MKFFVAARVTVDCVVCIANSFRNDHVLLMIGEVIASIFLV